MDRNQLIAGAEFVRDVMQYHTDRCLAGHDESDAERAAYAEGLEFITSVTSKVEELDVRQAQLSRAQDFLAAHPQTAPIEGDGVRHVPNINTRSAEDPFDLSTVSAFDDVETLRGRALSAIERMSHAEDDARQAATETLERFESEDGAVSRRYLITGSESYRSGWSKVITGRERLLTQDEATALSRAASLTDGLGGYAVPFLIDPTIVLTGSGSESPWRQTCRVVRGTSDEWNGLNFSGVTSRWAAEASESEDGMGTLTRPTIPAHKADSFVPASIEVTQDWQSMQSDLAMAFAESKDDREAAGFATGTGNGQPTGLITALVASSPTVIVTSTAADTFAKGDVNKLRSQLGAKYRGRGTWFGNLAIEDLIAGFGSTDDAFTIDFTQGSLPALKGRPFVEASTMDDTINAGAENYILAFGAAENYVIYDRIGATIEYIPHLFGTGNNRPTGQRGWYMYWRVGADSRNDNAFRLLNVT